MMIIPLIMEKMSIKLIPLSVPALIKDMMQSDLKLMTKDQAVYIGVTQAGPYKPEHLTKLINP